MRKRDICRLISIAFSWHGGGGSPLYQFASTRKIHADEHRRELETEINKCLTSAKRRDGKQLDRLMAFVKTAPINVEFVTNDDMGDYSLDTRHESRVVKKV